MSFSYIEASLVKLSVLGAAAMAIATTCNTLFPTDSLQNNGTEPIFSVSTLHRGTGRIETQTTTAYRASGRFDNGLGTVKDHRGTGRISECYQQLAYRASGRFQSIENQFFYHESEHSIEHQNIA